MATFRDSSANSKHVSKIPKRMPTSPSRRSNQLSQLSSESTMSNLTDSSTKTNPQRIFEATKLNSACDFLSQLQSKLQNDVNKDQKTSVVVSKSSGSNKLSEENDKMSGIVSSILDTLKDISENFPLISQEDHKDTISQLLDLRRTSSLLSHTEKCFFLSQHFTVNHLQQDLSGGHSNKRSDKADQEKLIMDKQLLQQLADLQLLLQDTIAKLEDKGTFTQEDDIKSVNNELSDATSKACKAKCAKKFSKFKRQAPPEPQVQVGYEAKPSPEKDKLHIPQVKRLLEILQSPEIRPFLENKLTAPDSHLLLCACHSAIPTPPNTEVTKTESEATKPDDKLDSTFIFPAIDDVTTPELSDDDAYPAEYKCCLCYGDDEVEPQKPSSPYATFHDFEDPAKSPLDQETPPILPPPSPFSGSDAKGDEESLYKSGSPKVSPAVQPMKVEKEPIIPIKSSSMDSKTSPKNLKSPKESAKNGDKMSPKGSASPKSVKSFEEEGASAKKGDKMSPKGSASPKSVKSIDGVNNEPKKGLCKARCAPFKCLERTPKHPSEKSPEKSPEPSRKSSVKSKFLFPRKKSNAAVEESKKPKDKQDKSKKSGKQDGTDKGNKGSPKEKAQVEEEHPPQDLTPAPIILTAMTPTNAEVSKPTSQDTYHHMAGDIPSPVSVTPVPVEEDIPIPPPPTFDYDSYIGVEPAGEDSFASFVRCQEEAAKAHNKTGNTSLTSTAVAKSVIYGNEKPCKTRITQVIYSLDLVTVFQVISNPSIKSKENVKSPFKTTERDVLSDETPVGDGDSDFRPIFIEGSTTQQIPLPFIRSDVVASKSQVINEDLSSPFIPTFPADLNLEKGKSNKALKKTVSIQEYSLEPKQINRGSGGSKSMVTDASQATSNNRITLNYSVQVVPSFWDGKGTKESTSTTPPGKSLERVLMKSKSVSIVLPKSQSAVIRQISYEEPPTVSKIIPHGTTVFTAMSKSPSMVNIGTGEARRYSASSANFLNKRVNPRLSDPDIARLACRHCMCSMGGPPIEKRMSDKETEVDRVDKLNEFEFLDKGSPPRYFEQVIQEIDMMRNCIEFALNNQLNVHDKIKAYLDDGSGVKSKYPHFHTVVDGIPIILIWKEDPGHVFKHMKRKKSKVLDSTIWRKSKSSLSKKGLRKPHVKGSSAGEKFSSSTGPRHFDKKGSYKSKLLLENLANTMAKYRGKKKHPYKCDECGARCPGKYDKFTHSCSTPPATGVQRKSSSHSNVDRKGRRKSSSPESGTHSPLRKRSKGSLTPKTSKAEGFRSRTKSPEGSPSRKKSQGGGSPTRKKSQLGGFLGHKKSQEAPSSVGCFCDDEPDKKERDNLKRRHSSRTASFPKLLKCKSIKTLFGSADEECCEKQKCPTRNHSMHKGKRIFPRNKSTNVPSNSDSTSMQTYYLTARPKVSKESPSKNRGDSESDNDMPYLIDVQSLPQFEHPETVCSSKLFDVKQVDCELRNEIKTGNKNVKDTLLRINLNALLDSFKPAKCCKKMVINGRTRSTYPYPASLQSLPLSEEDLDRILEIMQSNNQKRFDTTKRLYVEPEFNFQTATEVVYFFELFKKAESKPTSATTSTTTTVTTTSRTVVPQTGIKHDLKIFEFIRRIYTSHPISEKRVPKKKKDSTKTLYRHRSNHRKHGTHKRRQHSRHHRPKVKQRSTSTSMLMMPIQAPSKPASSSSLTSNKPVRNISFLLIPKSELSNYFCGELSSMYSPSLNSLPFDDSEHQVIPSSKRSKDLNMINEEETESALTPTEYARTLGAIYEMDESDKEYPVREVSKEEPCSASTYSMPTPPPIKRMTTNFQVMTCRVSTTNTSKDILDEMKTATGLESISTNSSSTTQSPEIPLQRKPLESDLSVRKQNLFSNSSILTNRSSSRIPISCLPLSCSLNKDKSNFLHLPNILTDTKRFLHRPKDDGFKPNLDKITERTSETTSTTFSTGLPRHRRKTLRRSNCCLSLNATSPRMERKTSTPEVLSLKNDQLLRVISSNRSDIKKEFGYDLPLTLEMIPPNDERTRKEMKIDKSVVAYAISPSSEFTFLSEDGTKPRDQQGKFKSENICVWPVYQNRSTKKKNSAFVVAIHSSAGRLSSKEPQQSGDQAGPHDEYCEFCRRKRNLSTDSFILGYIGESLQPTMDSKSDNHSSSKKEKKEKSEEKEKPEKIEKPEKLEKPEKVEKPEKEEKRQSGEREKKDRAEKDVNAAKKSYKKESASSVMKKRKTSKRIVPEVIDIKVPTNVKSTRLKHKFCNGGDRPGYVTVLSTPCNCPDVTIFIPCYCSDCQGKKNGKRCRHKSAESDYAMVPIIERTEVG